MKKNNMVSVIIPAFNAMRFIKETVNSVLQQTYSHLEVIIVNDGSEDSTFDLLEEIKNNDERIKIINKNNTGVSDSRNVGIKEAKGSFITFLDADDIWDIFFLENCLEVLEKNKSICAVYTKGQLINEKSEKLDKFIEANTIHSVDDILEWKKGFVATPSCTVFRFSTSENIQFWDSNLSTAADQDYFIRIAIKSPILAINKVLFYYRIHDDNMHQDIVKMEKDHIYVFDKASKNRLFRNFWFRKKSYSNLYWILAGSWWKDARNKQRGAYFIVLAIYNNPLSIIRVFKKIAFV